VFPKSIYKRSTELLSPQIVNFAGFQAQVPVSIKQDQTEHFLTPLTRRLSRKNIQNQSTKMTSHLI